MMLRTTTAILLLVLAFPTFAQEHSHEGEVGKFYQEWHRPDNRFMSCCNNLDCAAVSHVRRVNGQWEFQRTSDDVWVIVPDSKIENYVDDAHDSPDGKSHMCSSGELVFCAVLGNGM